MDGISRDSIAEFFTALWGLDALPGKISICYRDRDGVGDFRCAGFFPTIDLAADKAAKLAVNSCVWMGVGLLRSDITSGRGTSKDVVALPGLWCEIDYGKPNGPLDLEAALSVVSALPLRPTIIIHSGHGIHCYWLFQELLELPGDADRAFAQSLLFGIWNLLNKELRRRSFCDADAIYDLARVLRPVGTANCKNAGNRLPVITLEQNSSSRYSPADFEQFIPEEPTEETKEPTAPTENSKWVIRPGDDFNGRTTWPEVARLIGWSCTRRGDGRHELLRCASVKYGKPSSSFTGKTGYLGRDRITIFSGNCGLKSDVDQFGRRSSYSKFELFAAVIFPSDEHPGEGIFPAAAEYLFQRGFGKKREHPAATDQDSGTQNSTADEGPENIPTRYAELLGSMSTNGEMFARAAPPKFLIRNFLTAGTVTLWSAPEKAWKTTLGHHVALVVAGHGKFLGEYEVCTSGRVVFFSGESGYWPLKSMQERILDWIYPHKDGRSASKPDPASIPIIWGDDPPDLATPEAIAALADQIRRAGARLLILDPSQALFSSSSEEVKNDFCMRPFMKKLQLLARETDCAILILHHFRQHVPPGFPKRSDSSYGALIKFCDTWVLMNHREEPTGDEEPGSGRLWLTWGSRDGFGATHAINIAEGTHETGRYFELKIVGVDAAIDQIADHRAQKKDKATKVASKANSENRKAKIRNALTGRQTGITTTTLAGKLRCSRSSIAPTVAAMLIDGELVNVPAEYLNNGRIAWTQGLALPETKDRIIKSAISAGWKQMKKGDG